MAAPRQAPPSKRALRLAWIAARLHSVSSSSFEDFSSEELETPMTYRQAWGAAGSLQARSRWRGMPGPRPDEPRDQGGAPAVWDWAVVDEPAFGLLRVLYRLPNDGMPRPGLLDSLGELPGVRQVLEVSGDREVLVIGLVESLGEARALRARIEDHAVEQPVRMDFISYENHQPARRTWIELARRHLRLDREGAS